MPSVDKLSEKVFSILAKRMESKEPCGLSAGLLDLDEYLGGGWNRQELTYLVGDSGKGKSWLASYFMLQGAKWLCEHPGVRPMTGYLENMDSQVVSRVRDKQSKIPIIVLWSLEMSEIPVVVRLMTQATAMKTGMNLDSALIKQGKYTRSGETEEVRGERQRALSEGYGILHTSFGPHLYVIFNDHNVTDFRKSMDELSLKYDICLVVIDYFRLIQEAESDGSIPSAQQEKSSELKLLAKEYDTHVLSIFDINRQGQIAKKVDLRHMRGGVAAQYDADVVLMLSWGEEIKEDEHPINVHVVLTLSKNRFGQWHQFDLTMNLMSGKIEPYYIGDHSTLPKGDEWKGDLDG